MEPTQEDKLTALEFLVTLTYNFFGKRVIILIDEIDYTVLNFLESNIKELSQGLVDCSTRKKLREISDTIEQMGQTIIKPSTSFIKRRNYESFNQTYGLNNLEVRPAGL